MAIKHQSLTNETKTIAPDHYGIEKRLGDLTRANVSGQTRQSICVNDRVEVLGEETFYVLVTEIESTHDQSNAFYSVNVLGFLMK